MTMALARHQHRFARRAVVVAAVCVAVLAGLVAGPSDPAQAVDADRSLRFYGHGTGDIDRVKIRLDAPARPIDVGATDFTLEFWMRANAGDNPASAVACGANVAWINGHTILDRDRYNRDRKFGLSLAGGRLVWGETGPGGVSLTICGRRVVADGAWHHVAVTRKRADGWMGIWVDGVWDASGNGPDGDVSYPNGSVGGDFCNGPCLADPLLVVGAEKHDAGPAYPSYSGYLDELRVSKVRRYTAAFTRPSKAFTPTGGPSGCTTSTSHPDRGHAMPPARPEAPATGTSNVAARRQPAR